MAYGAGDFLVEIKGTTVLGEIWSNTWCFQTVTTDVQRQDVVFALQSFYGDLAALMTDEWTAQAARGTDLFNDVSADYSFGPIAGSLASDALPSQLAIRISLSNALGDHGGPFLTGFTINSADTNGLIDTTTANTVVTEVDDLKTLVEAEGGTMAIHRPSVPQTTVATIARVGQRFDIIRKRANDILENYTTVSW